jgi:HTH-type transcriptional regulator/antitoxin HigA
MSLQTKRRRGAPSDSYLSLIHRFPLRAIRDDRELDEAVDLINELLDRPKLDQGETDYLDVLGSLVEAYEESAHPIEPASDAAILESLLRDRGQTQLQVAAATGIANSTLSNVLHSKRQLTRDHIRQLAKHFKVDPRVFHG